MLCAPARSCNGDQGRDARAAELPTPSRGALSPRAGAASAALFAPDAETGVFRARALASEDTVTLENVTVEGRSDAFRLKRVEFSGCNLSRDEAAKLFSQDAAGKAALFEKLQAKRISIPEAVSTSPKNETLTLRDFVAENVTHGTAERITLAGFEGTFPDADGETSLRGFPLTVDGVDLRALLASAKDGKASEGTPS